MTTRQRVVWDEGMMLAPQHFQQWERWVEGEFAARAPAPASHRHGFTALALDPGALAGGSLLATHLQGFFADGTGFSCPDRDALPPALPVADRIDDRSGECVVLLGVPRQVHGASVYGDGGESVPKVRERARVVDAARPETEREIATARLNLRFVTAADDLSAFETLPVARLVRAAGGGVEVARDFAAPSLAVAAAPMAHSVLHKVVGMLAQKWTEMSGKRRGAGGGMADASGLLLLQTVGENLPLLRHCVEHRGVPLEQVYLHLARLCAQLCTFHQSNTPVSIPSFDHDAPGPALHQIGEMLQQMLGDAAPNLCDTLALEREGESMFWARIPSPDMMTHGALYLSVRAEAGEDEIRSRFPTLSKISARDRVQDLLMRAIPGLPVAHEPRPPAAIPSQAGRQYFRLEPGSEHWDAMLQSLTVAIHVSPGLPQLHLELMAVKQ